MLWKLTHRLFGYDYIAWKSFNSGGVARIRRSRDGAVYFMDDRNEPQQLLGHPAFYLQDGFGGVVLYHVLFLTCSPEKYLPRCDFRTYH